MENLPIGLLVMLALDMDTEDTLRLCQTSARLNRTICNNPDFWRKKINRDFGIVFPFIDLDKLREYYRLLYRAYMKGYWGDSYVIADENNYDDLIRYLKEHDVWGIINQEGKFRIIDKRPNALIDRRRNKGRLCKTFEKDELISILNHIKENMNDNVSSMNKDQICNLLRETLSAKGLIFPDL